MKQVKIGFDYEHLHYKPGQMVSDEIANVFPDMVKDVPMIVNPQEDEQVKEEVIEVAEEPVKEPAKKAKKVFKKSR